MRTLLLVAFFFLTLVRPSWAQTPAPMASDAMMGTWEFRSGDEVFRIVLRRDTSFSFYEYSFDVILGLHSYSKNGLIVEESFNKPKHKGMSASLSLMGSPTDDEHITFIYNDLTKNKTGEATLQFVPGSIDQVNWVLKEKKRTCPTVGNPMPKGFTVPTNMVLTRVQ